MKRLACVASALAILVLTAGADKAKQLTIKEIMAKSHKGDKALFGIVKAQLKADAPDWTLIKDSSKEIADLSVTLPDLAPKKGDKANYAKLAGAYYNDAKALDVAAQAEDKAAAKSALGKVGASCKACHTAHRGK